MGACIDVWLQEDGQAIQASGFGTNPTPNSLPDQKALMMASQEAFGWVTHNCKGYPS
ncbi:predicted protein [Coccidioides posadasii str. Silveira]|uniref:Predicted protein n=1 Tax=Coccidioides posadasii (strain RMSCC 757 / Silveira) TaxID=443226 RepID=E9D6P4_COCPS|nr:predicted protein [Coccidioides posadasii str. Silveira]